MPPQLPSKDSNCGIASYSEGESLSGNIRAVQELHSKGREHDYSPLAAGCIKDLMQSVPLEKITQAIKKDVPLSHLVKSSKHCSSPGTRAALRSKGKAAVALVSPFWRQEPMGKAAAPLAVKKICRHSRAVPAESEADLDSNGRSKAMLGCNHSLVPTGVQGLPRLQEQDKQPQTRGSRELQHLTGSSCKEKRVTQPSSSRVALWEPKALAGARPDRQVGINPGSLTLT